LFCDLTKIQRKTIIYLVIVLIIVLAALGVWYYFSISSNNAASGKYIAVVNKTTNQIIWVGGGSLCIPYVNNTELKYNCKEIISTEYSCGGVDYNLSSHQISCGTESNSS
jgi:uncharacterized SAM-binding protein YcdF (DUF218 family)